MLNIEEEIHSLICDLTFQEIIIQPIILPTLLQYSIQKTIQNYLAFILARNSHSLGNDRPLRASRETIISVVKAYLDRKEFISPSYKK